MNSPIARLVTHASPVDRKALFVGFYKGDHFEVEFTEDRPKYRLTFDAPPRSQPIPEGFRIIDHAGVRRGRMIACYLHRVTFYQSGKPRCIWVCRCDCGRYEFRNPRKWLKSKVADDCCEVCRREQEMLSGNIPRKSKKTMPERLMRWIESMRSIGLSDLEITAIRQGDITTEGKSAAEIREVIKAGVL